MNPQSTPTAQIGNSPSLPMALEFRQLGDIGRDPSGLVPGEQLGCGLPAHPCRPLREPVDCLPLRQWLFGEAGPKCAGLPYRVDRQLPT